MGRNVPQHTTQQCVASGRQRPATHAVLWVVQRVRHFLISIQPSSAPLPQSRPRAFHLELLYVLSALLSCPHRDAGLVRPCERCLVKDVATRS